MPLSVIAFEHASDILVAVLNQIFHSLFAHLLVVHGHAGQLQLRIPAVEEQNRDSPFLKLLVVMQIWIGEGAFGRLHNQSVYNVFVDQVIQYVLFPADPVAGKGNLGGVTFFGENPLDSPHHRRENIAVHIGTDYSDVHVPLLALRLAVAAHIRTASPHP